MMESWPIPGVSDVRRATMSLARRMRAERPQSGLTLRQLSLLGHLHRLGAMTPGELAAADRLQPQSVTRVLAELELAGLIARQRDQADGRQFRITITEEGLAALARDMSQRDAWLAMAMEQELSVTERELLRLAAQLMQRVADAEGVLALRSSAS